MSSPLRPARIVVYLALAAGMLWFAGRSVAHLRVPRLSGPVRYGTVMVSGNVDRPGRYRVPEGTTRFELLKVAGVRMTSDIAALDLAGQVESGQVVNVGSLATPVSVTATTAARLEYFLGTVRIVAHGGVLRPQARGIYVLPGDTVRTDSASQAELSLGPYTRLDVAQSSDLVMQRLAASEGGRRLTQLAQGRGSVWYRVIYTARNERLSVSTPWLTATAAGTGADFLLEAMAGSARVHCLEGVLLLSRPDGSETVNLVAGQSATVWSDTRPFQVLRTGAEVSTARLFGGLQQQRVEQVSADDPINFVFCTLPQAFYLVSVQFTSMTVFVVQLPGETSVEPYAQGFSTLQQAYLLGGGSLTATLVQQIMGTPVAKYTALGANSLLQIAAALGTVTVPVDDKAAKALGLRPGPQPLGPERLLAFLKPRISGHEDSRRRQHVVLRALVDAARERSIVVTTMLADRVIATTETNYSPLEVVAGYSRFTGRQGWTFKASTLPGTHAELNRMPVFLADMDAARRVLYAQ